MTSTTTVQTATHTGLQTINGQPTFVHGHGGIGSAGAVAIDVQIDGPIAAMDLPDPAALSADEAKAVWVRALSVVDEMADPTAYISAVGAIAHHAIRPPGVRGRAALAIVGAPGSGKTEVAKLAFANYGPAFCDASMASNSTTSTHPYTRAAAGAGGAAVLLDDARTCSTRRATENMVNEVEYAIRVSYEGTDAARARIRQDKFGAFRTEREMQSNAPMAVITAEAGFLANLDRSTAELLLPVQLPAGGVFRDRAARDRAIEIGADGTLAAAFAMFAMAWVADFEAPRDLKRVALASTQVTLVRPLLSDRGRNVAETIATGWALYVAAAQHAEAIDAERAAELTELGENLIADAAVAHAIASTPKSPAETMLTEVRQAIASGTAYLSADAPAAGSIRVGASITLRDIDAVALFPDAVARLMDVSVDVVRTALRPAAILVDGSTHRVVRAVQDGECLIRAICIPKEAFDGKARPTPSTSQRHGRFGTVALAS
jgi:hypothetical protein